MSAYLAFNASSAARRACSSWIFCVSDKTAERSKTYSEAWFSKSRYFLLTSCFSSFLSVELSGSRSCFFSFFHSDTKETGATIGR